MSKIAFAFFLTLAALTGSFATQAEAGPYDGSPKWQFDATP